MSAQPCGDRALAVMTQLVEREHRLLDEVRLLTSLNDRLAARVAELEDAPEFTQEVRKAYRTGYLRGHHSRGRGAEPVECPEASARGALGRIIRPRPEEVE